MVGKKVNCIMEKRISREFLFKKVLLDNHAVGLTLKSGEKIVVVDLFLSEEERKEIATNYSIPYDSYGDIGVYVLNSYTGGKVSRKINTDDILYVESI